MRFLFFSLLCLFSLRSHFVSAQWLPATNNSEFADILVTNQNRIIATQTSYNPDQGGTIYSDNGGRTWQPLKENPTGEQLRLRLLGKQGNKLYGTSSSGIWTSTDNGDSWELSPPPSPLFHLYYKKFKASDKCAVFVTNEDQAEMSISIDNGKTWAFTRIEFAGYISGIDVRSDTVFVSCRFKGTYRGTHVNNNWYWVNISTSGDLTDIAAINSDAYITTSPDIGAAIYRNGGVERFNLTNRDGGIESRFEEVYIFDNYWVITTHRTSARIFVSDNQGKTWKDFSGGLPKPFVTQTAHREVVISRVAFSKDTLYAVVDQGLMKRSMKELVANFLEAPTEVKADTSKRNTNIIKWADNSSTETGFIIERSQNSAANFQEVGRVVANAENFTDHDVPGGLTYYYRIKSYNNIASSAYSVLLAFNREANACKISEKVIFTAGFSSLKFINEKTGFWLKSNVDKDSYLLRTDDGGVTWNEVPFHMHIPGSSEIKFLDDKVGIIYRYPSFADDFVKFMTIDGGLTWRKVDNNHKLFIEKYQLLRKTIPFDQFFINDSTGFKASHYNAIFATFARTGDYGRSWIPLKIQPAPSNEFEYVNKIFFINNKTGFATFSGKIGITTDGGDTWAPAFLPQEFYNFADIYSPDKKNVYFIGNIANNTPGILKTTDNGKTFELINVSLKSNAAIASISFIGNKAWITTEFGELYVSDDNLKSWQVLSEQVNFYRSLIAFKGKWGLVAADVYAANKNKFMAYQTYDGGRSWEDIEFPSKITGSLGFAPKVKIFEENKAIVLNENVLYKTQDRGKTWTTVAQPFSQKPVGYIYNFYAVSEKVWFLNHRYDNEDYKLYRTIDGGNTWQYLPDVIDPFDGFYFFGNNLGFVRGNSTGWYKTTDGGNTWTDFYRRNDRFFEPSDIWFIDSKNGFMAGGGVADGDYEAKILRTKDSGNTWEEVVLNQAIRDKRVLGKIKFFNDKVGYVTTREDIIKTTDGGITWAITTYDKFFNEYTSLINFDDYYSAYGTDRTSELKHYGPENTPAKPHQPNGDIDACLYTNAATLYSVDNNDTYSYEWKLSGGGNLSANRNEAKVKWTQLGTFKLSVRAINNCGVSEWQEAPATVNSLPAKPSLASGNLSPCPQTNQVYQLNNTSGYTYEWMIPANVSKTTNKNSVNINWTQENQTFVLKAVSYNGVCPSDTLSFEVKTKALPLVPSITKGTTLTSSSAINNQWLFADKPMAGATQQTLTPEETGTYSVQVSNECGTRKSEAIYVFVQILATEEEKDDLILLYPNPVDNELLIRSKQYPIQSVYLYDSSGRIIKTLSDNSSSEHKMNVMDLSSGVYILKIVTNNQVINRKVIIHK